MLAFGKKILSGLFGQKKRKGKVRTYDKSKPADAVLLVTVIALLVFGLVMITSIGVPKSIQLSAPDVLYPNCQDEGVDCYLLFKNHAIRLAIGLIAMLVGAKIPYQFWKKMAPLIFVGVVILLFAVLFIGSSYTTFARSWLVIFNTSVQPTEFAKLALVFYLASWIGQRKEQIGTFQNGFLQFCVIAGILMLPVVLQPDLGSALVLAAIAGVIYFVGGADLKHFLAGVVAVGLLGVALVSASDHVGERIEAFISPDANCSKNYCWQSEQSKIAIGSGGVWGKGLTQGVQKSYWLPQATDDFIFAASAEELGFFRISLVILAYGVIAYRGYLIARGAPNRFAMLLATGLTAWIFFQAFVNIAVNLAIFPVTGITLPFVSYGGSSLISLLIAVGILLQISKYSDYASSNGRRRVRRPYNS